MKVHISFCAAMLLRERMQQLVYGLFPQKATPRYASAPPETASS